MRKIILLASAAIMCFGAANEVMADSKTGDECEPGKVACGTSCINSGETCYAYDDDGRLKEIINYSEYSENTTRTVLTYENGKLTGGTQYYIGSAYPEGQSFSLYVANTEEGTYLAPETSGYAFGIVLDQNGKILREGLETRAWGGTVEDAVAYAYDGDKKTGQKRISCDGTLNGDCADAGDLLSYEYLTDDDENIIALKLGDKIVAKYNYTDAYIANRAAQKCNSTKSCTSCPGGKVLQGKECVSSCSSSFRLNDGECDRIRYTPAEAAEVLKDTDNEIIMTFKVNR